MRVMTAPPVLSALQSQHNARLGARFESREGDATDPTATIAAGSLKGIVFRTNCRTPSASIRWSFAQWLGGSGVLSLPRCRTRGGTSSKRTCRRRSQIASRAKMSQSKPSSLGASARPEHVSQPRWICGAAAKRFSAARITRTNWKLIEFHEIYVPVETVPELADMCGNIPEYAYELAEATKVSPRISIWARAASFKAREGS